MKTTPHPDDHVLPVRRRLLVSAIAAGLGLPALGGCGGGDPAQPAPLAAGVRRRALGGVDSGGTGGKKSFFSAALQRTAPLAAAGVTFDATACLCVDADGVPFDASALAVGMTTWIDGSVVSEVDGQPTAAALQLRLADQLVGAVEAVDPATATMRVLGQMVSVDIDTVFDPTLAADWTTLTPGTRIRVWGQLDPSGARIVATRLDAPDIAAPDLVRGVLGAVDPDTGRIVIGRLQALPATDAVVPAGLAAGQVVRLTLLPGGDGMPHWQVVRADPLPLPDRDTVEVEGRLTAISAPDRFELDGVPVDARQADGGVPDGLTPGRRVVVEGRSSAGILLAARVTLLTDEPDLVVELQGGVQTVDAEHQRFTVRRTTVAWSTETRFEGGGAALLRPGRRVEVKGRRGGPGLVQAFYVHVER
jgi:hypothetical protein